MKKPLTVLIGLLALAIGVVTLSKLASHGGTETEAQAVGVDKHRIKRFWYLYNQATTLRSQGDFSGAVTAYREALVLNPIHEDSLYYLGASLKEIGDYDAALAAYRRMIERNPSSGRALSELGNTLALTVPGAPTDFEGARKAFQRNVQINPEQSGPFLQLGMLDLNQGRFASAIENFRVAAGFSSPEANFYLGYTLYLQKRYRDALPYFLKVLDTYAKDKKIVARGVLSEGDVLPAPGKPMTALEKAGLRSMLLLYWTASRAGGYPASVPREFQIHDHGPSRPLVQPGAFEFAVAKPEAPTALAAGDRRGGTGTAQDRLGRLNSCRRLMDGFPAMSRSAGLSLQVTVVDCAVADYDRDGRPDIFLLNWKREAALYRNEGHGKFSDVTRHAGLGGIRSESFSAIFFDYDRDGFPDLLVTAHAPYEEVARCLLQPALKSARNTPRLFRNKGNGTFEDVSDRLGLNRGCYGTTQALAVDLDADGWPDLILVNGSTDALRVEPSVVLRNVEGKEFREWFFVPDFDAPGNFLGAKVAMDGGGRPRRAYLFPNPILRGSRMPGNLLVDRLIQRSARVSGAND